MNKKVLKQKVSRVAMFAMCVLMAFACKNQMKDNIEYKFGKSGEELIQSGLKGSVWKLEGIADSNTGRIKELAPKDCEVCYTLWFDTDNTVTILSIQNRLKLDLINLNPFIASDDMLRCSKYDKDGKDYCDSDGFERLITTTGSFLATDTDLKLYQHHQDLEGKIQISTSYLLFKRIAHEQPSTLRGTKWKLVSMVDTQTGETSELEPKKCNDCYTLTFWGDSVLSAQSIWATGGLDLSNLDIIRDPNRPGIYSDPEPLYAETWDKDNKTYEDSWIYRCGIAYTKSYELRPGELKLFFVFKEKKYYLLFKSVYL